MEGDGGRGESESNKGRGSQSRGFSAPPARSQWGRGLLTLLCVEEHRWETPSLKPAPLDSSGVTSNQLCPAPYLEEAQRGLGWVPRPE